MYTTGPSQNRKLLYTEKPEQTNATEYHCLVTFVFVYFEKLEICVMQVLQYTEPFHD
jgi:hypothetical protein